MKKLLFILSCGLMFLHGAEILKPSDASQWFKIRGADPVKLEEIDGENVFVIRGVGDYRSRDFLKIVPGKSYLLSGEFKSAEKSVPAKLFFGLYENDKNGKLITSAYVFAIKDTQTKLLDAAPAGTVTLKVKDASKWQTKVGSCAAFNVKSDFSDLPNPRLSPKIKSVAKVDNGYLLTLAEPLKHSYPAGTAIRQHRFAGSYHYTAGNKMLTADWQSFSIIITGTAAYGVPVQRWWRGIDSAALLILANYGGGSDSVMLMKNLKLEELTR